VLTVRRNPQSTGNESCGLSFKIQILSERFSAPTLYSFLIVQFSNRKRPSKYATPKQTVRRFQGTQYSVRILLQTAGIACRNSGQELKTFTGRTGVGRKGRQNLGTVLLKRVEVFHKDRCAAIARASNRQLGFSLVLVHRMRRWKILTKTWTDTWLSLMKRLEVVPARFGNQLFEPLMCLYDALTPYGCQRIELFSF